MPSEKRELTRTKMKVAALVIDKPSSPSPSLSLSPRLPPCPYEVFRWRVLEDAQHCLVGCAPTPTHCWWLLTGTQLDNEHPMGLASDPAQVSHHSKLRQAKDDLQFTPACARHCLSTPCRIGALVRHLYIHPPSFPYRGAWFARCWMCLKTRPIVTLNRHCSP